MEKCIFDRILRLLEIADTFQRKNKAGRKSRLTVLDKLVITLQYWREYRTYRYIVVDELSRMDIDYSELIRIERDSNGKVLAINTDIKKVNILKSEIATKVQSKLSSVGTRTIYIAMGTLTGTEILNGVGPKVPLKITMAGSILTDLNSTFISAGINQTKHQIYLDVSTKIFAIIPGYPVSTGVETNVAVAETVIVGDVPNVFASLDGKNSQTLGRVDDLAKLDKENPKKDN